MRKSLFHPLAVVGLPFFPEYQFERTIEAQNDEPAFVASPMDERLEAAWKNLVMAFDDAASARIETSIASRWLSLASILATPQRRDVQMNASISANFFIGIC